MRFRPHALSLLLVLVGAVAATSIPAPPAAPQPAARAAPQKYWVYWDQNEEEDYYQSPSGKTGRLIQPWDPNGQMCLLPGGSGRFTTGYNPTTADQHNPGGKKPKKNPPVGEALWDPHGRFTGKTIHVPGPYHLRGSRKGGDIPPDKGTGGPEGGGHFNSNGTFTGCAVDSHGNLFATDIGTGQGAIPVPDDARLIEWFAPKYSSYCILYGPTKGGVGPHHVDGTGGMRDPGTLARDSHNNIYVPEPGNSTGTGFPDAGRVLRFLHASLPTSAKACPAPSNMPKRKVQVETFIQGGSQGLQQVPSGIARDPSCKCWAVTSVEGNPAIAWYDDSGNPYPGKGPVPAGSYSPFGIAVAPDGTTYFADIHVQPCQSGFCTTDGQAAIYKVTFNNGVPSQPETIGAGFSFPVGVTVCVPSRQACPAPRR